MDPSEAAAGAKRPCEADGQFVDNEPYNERKKHKRDRNVNKFLPPVKQMKLDIEKASGENDVTAGFALFNKAVEEGISLLAPSYNTLLHLCGVAAGVTEPRQLRRKHHTGNSVLKDLCEGALDLPEKAEETQIPELPTVTCKFTQAEVYATAKAIFAHMKESRVAVTEASYTALARVICANDEPDKALGLVTEMKEAGLTPRLRTFALTLQKFCLLGRLEEARAMEQILVQNGLQLTEAEYRNLLSANAKAGEKAAVDDLLQRIRLNVPFVSEETVAVLQQCFTDGWQVGRTRVDDEGVSQKTGDQLASVDLTEEQRERLASGIKKLAMEREKKDNFEKFTTWSEDNGPITTFVDGANVALYGQNFQDGGFNFVQLDKMMRHVAAEQSEGQKPPLLVLHVVRTLKGPANEQRNKQIIKKWQENNWLWTTPGGSNDDWYWLYGAVKAGEGSFLITNDEMRDHIFQMLPEPELFYRWKDRHQVRFRYDRGQPVCMYPLPYSQCVQHLADGSWYFPIKNEQDEEFDWFYAKPIVK